MDQGKWYEPFMGYLFKRGNEGVLKMWKRRWFVLSNNSLIYSKSEDESNKILGTIDLKKCQNIHLSSGDVVRDILYIPSGGYFQIDTPDRIYYLMADSKDGAQKWVDVLNYSKSLYAEKERHDIEIKNAKDIEKTYAPSAPLEDVGVYGDYLTYVNPNTKEPNVSQPNSNVNSLFVDRYLKEILFTEGDALKYYRNQFATCCNILLGINSVLPNESINQKKIICVYLGLKSLEFDSRESLSLCSTDGIDQEPISQYLNFAISICQAKILGLWTLDGPTILTKIDIWIKRKKSMQQILFRRGDKESIIKWNLVIVQDILNQYILPQTYPDVENSVISLRNMLFFQLENLPATKFSKQLLNSINISSDKNNLKGLLTADLLFQKLKIENDALGFFKCDPFLANTFDSILHEFSETKRLVPQLLSLQHDLRTSEMKIFTAWQGNQNLLHINSSVKQDQFTLFLKNERLLKRIAIKLDKSTFPTLQDALFLAAISLEERMPKIDGQGPSVPFPESDLGTEILNDFVTSIQFV